MRKNVQFCSQSRVAPAGINVLRSPIIAMYPDSACVPQDATPTNSQRTIERDVNSCSCEVPAAKGLLRSIEVLSQRSRRVDAKAFVFNRGRRWHLGFCDKPARDLEDSDSDASLIRARRSTLSHESSTRVKCRVNPVGCKIMTWRP